MDWSFSESQWSIRVKEWRVISCNGRFLGSVQELSTYNRKWIASNSQLLPCTIRKHLTHPHHHTATFFQATQSNNLWRGQDCSNMVPHSIFCLDNCHQPPVKVACLWSYIQSSSRPSLDTCFHITHLVVSLSFLMPLMGLHCLQSRMQISQLAVPSFSKSGFH